MTSYTPRDLELMVKHELEKVRPKAARSLRIQILRGRGAWYPVCHFPPDQPKDDQLAITDLITSIGQKLAPRHELIG